MLLLVFFTFKISFIKKKNKKKNCPVNLNTSTTGLKKRTYLFRVGIGEIDVIFMLSPIRTSHVSNVC